MFNLASQVALRQLGHNLFNIVNCSGTGGDIGCVFHHAERFAILVQNGVIRGLNPDFLVAFTKTFVLAGLVDTVIQLIPERTVIIAVAGFLIHKHAVMFAFNFVKSIAKRIEEILIGVDNHAVHIELNHSLGFANS